jgi:hypothetical protein
MHYAALATAFEATVLLSTLAALTLGTRLAQVSETSQPASPSRFHFRFHFHHLFSPLPQFLLVCAVVYLNQILFGAFILRAHGGSTAFIAQYIPGDWFAIGRHDPLVVFTASHVGDGRWLSPTLLRVQAFLELPFTMFAYLAVARLLGRRLYATLCHPVLLALTALSFSVTFSLVELSLPNPYTHDDLVLRAIACVATPMYIAWISRAARRAAVPAETSGPSGVLGLLAFLAGAGAISYVVLALYDAFLLYNLAYLPRYMPGLVIALVIAAVASFAAPRVDAAVARLTGARVPSLGIAAAVSALRTFTVLFFVPSLSLRYWGAHSTAAICGAGVVLVALVAGTVGALRRAEAGAGAVLRVLFAGGIALGLGGWAAQVAMTTGGHHIPQMPELLLARMALSFLAVAITSFRAVEIALCWAAHETKATADQA